MIWLSLIEINIIITIITIITITIIIIIIIIIIITDGMAPNVKSITSD